MYVYVCERERESAEMLENVQWESWKVKLMSGDSLRVY